MLQPPAENSPSSSSRLVLGTRMNIRGVMACSMLALSLFFGSCGNEEDCQGKKDGKVCSDCSGAGDCSNQCSTGEQEFCVGLEYFGGENPNDLRCTFCE